eukprot:3215070-Alexandrium_andersonii.AAC.1
MAASTAEAFECMLKHFAGGGGQGALRGHRLLQASWRPPQLGGHRALGLVAPQQGGARGGRGPSLRDL